MEVKETAEKILRAALAARASDIFFLPKEESCEVKLRSREPVKLADLSKQAGSELISWFKYAAQMDISEHRRPQVGAMSFDKCWLRLSSLGDYRGEESLVIRVIYGISGSRYFFPDQFTRLAELCKKRGLIVTSGPTGSGKTTTMYELARRLSQTRIVMTIEDPVEVHESSFLQTQVNLPAGISYASLLKAALRHRPDVLIIGEIRDGETAHLAIDAALSGHLVLATVHAKSTYQTISRLESLGIGTNALANCLTAVSYQRLLPAEGGPACLLDIAAGADLAREVARAKRSSFASWEEHLAELLEEGRIDEAVADQFAQG